MAIFVFDSFTEGSDALLANHTGEIGGTWTAHPSYAPSTTVDAATGRIFPTGDPQAYYASGIPPSADYYVQSPVFCHTVTTTNIGPALRMDTSANTMYQVRYRDGVDWQLRRIVGGGAATLGSTTNQLISAGNSKMARILAVGDQLSVYIDGILEIGPITDATPITAAGRAGFRSAGVVLASTGFHLDSFEAGTLETPSPSFRPISLRPAIFKPGRAR